MGKGLYWGGIKLFDWKGVHKAATSAYKYLAKDEILARENEQLNEELAENDVKASQIQKDNANYEAGNVRRDIRLSAAEYALQRESNNEQTRAAAIRNYQGESSAEAATAGSGISDGTPFEALRLTMGENRRALSEAMRSGRRSLDLKGTALAYQGQDSTHRASLLGRSADIGIDNAEIRMKGVEAQNEYNDQQFGTMAKLVDGASFMLSAYTLTSSLASLGTSIATNGGLFASGSGLTAQGKGMWQMGSEAAAARLGSQGITAQPLTWNSLLFGNAQPPSWSAIESGLTNPSAFKPVEPFKPMKINFMEWGG